ncbi:MULTISPECIES: sodium:solute symporter family protein [unclassified Imperialibacter]|uniref:sodium:solute symporter family protein n=1 Tax=unclassified Imperialibacter TaxID=2629706 RepID=UPI001257B2D1|nr:MULTISPECIES: sodium:solute symporter family protein [unclassified Imperialibacter]CAD5291365.1 Na+/proline symporter [Imperialibacter sp. 89]CAD5291588.1 Na+/proline symporter [Imperialibacter sp. 75]VVT34365.1 Na+/proline symporter [Imperialibacter sp. EC-SDR9]
MVLSTLDWVIIAVFFAIVVGIGWVASLTAGKSTSEYFLGGRGMPWWLLGISMVACTFSADTPNLVTGMVRENGVAKNWAWWAFLITGMVTVFIYARLWRRSNVMTDLEFYELRYSGKYASFLRGFRSLYLGIFFNCLIMGTVTLAAIKIGQIMLGIENPVYIVVGASIGVVIYATIGGIKGVIWADFFQYSIAMLGAVIAAVVAVSDERVGGLTKLLAHPNVMPKLDIFPSFDDPKQFLPLLIIPIAVQWWSVWYPGAEPGGGGYIAQRMLSAKDEKNAIGATLLFNFAHYALRPWPWILVALASLVIFPDLASIKAEFPGISDNYLGHDIAYPAMLTLLGTGWKGLVVASIIAAYMSTIGTHLNWGSSYVVNDFYKRFVKPDATEKQQVSIARFTTVGLMIFAATFSLTILKNATQAFDILLLSGAGTGAIYILRWFWWRINALTEIVAMVVATVLAFLLVLVISPEALDNAYLDVFSTRLLISLFGVSAAWISTTLLTKPEDKETLRSFYLRTQPGGPGWKKVVDEAMSEGIVLDASKGANWQMPLQVMMVFVGCVSIYCSLFGIGSFIYGNIGLGFGLLGIAAAGTVILFRNLGKLSLK